MAATGNRARRPVTTSPPETTPEPSLTDSEDDPKP